VGGPGIFCHAGTFSDVGMLPCTGSSPTHCALFYQGNAFTIKSLENQAVALLAMVHFLI
jgi:hypothetical protein